MLTVEVQNRVVGAAANTPTVPTVAIHLEDQQITVSSLIRTTVIKQIEQMTTLGYEPQQTQRALDCRYLTQAEVAQQAGNGKISLPTLPKPKLPRINQENEIRKAREAFTRGTYLIIVDGYQPHTLDEVLTLKPDSKISFVRLMPLRGG